MSPHARRLAAIWVRALLTAAVVLMLPQLFGRLLPSLDANGERVAMAQELERRQRAGGELTVLPSGEVRRAVVFTAAPPSEQSAPTARRGLVAGSGFLALVVLLGALRRTYHVVQDAHDAAQSGSVS
jgi:hypothetical protein